MLRSFPALGALLAVLAGGLLMAQSRDESSDAAPPANAAKDSVAVIAEGETPPKTVKAGKEEVLLKQDTFLDVWKHYSSRPEVPLQEVWRLVRGEDGTPELVCTGDPKGYLFTVEKFSDFRLSFEWKYPDDPHGNSGILVFTQDDRRLWPTSIQVQLHHPKAGSVFPSGDATSRNTSDAADLAVQADSWNRCVIDCQNGVVSVTVNEKKAGEVTDCRPSEGSIAIQSEGSVVHFRNITIVRMDATVTAAVESKVE
ncbi:MAG: DUF1080 domain-containing protein [Planctomycetaceae bacterium]